MLKLWQWHKVRAIGENAIIRAANNDRLSEYAHALEVAANGPADAITTIDDARRFYLEREIGCVSEYEIVDLDGVICEVRKSR